MSDEANKGEWWHIIARIQYAYLPAALLGCILLAVGTGAAFRWKGVVDWHVQDATKQLVLMVIGGAFMALAGWLMLFPRRDKHEEEFPEVKLNVQNNPNEWREARQVDWEEGDPPRFTIRGSFLDKPPPEKYKLWLFSKLVDESGTNYLPQHFVRSTPRTNYWTVEYRQGTERGPERTVQFFLVGPDADDQCADIRRLCQAAEGGIHVIPPNMKPAFPPMTYRVRDIAAIG